MKISGEARPTQAASAASTTWSCRTCRWPTDAHRTSRVARAASASRFHRVHVDRRAITPDRVATASRVSWSLDTTAAGGESTDAATPRDAGRAPADRPLTGPIALARPCRDSDSRWRSAPAVICSGERCSRAEARRRHHDMRSVRRRAVFGGRTCRVIRCRSCVVSTRLGPRPRVALKSATAATIAASTCADRVENSANSRSGSPASSKAGVRRGPRSRCSHATGSTRARWSANRLS